METRKTDDFVWLGASYETKAAILREKKSQKRMFKLSSVKLPQVQKLEFKDPSPSKLTKDVDSLSSVTLDQEDSKFWFPAFSGILQQPKANPNSIKENLWQA